MSFGQITLSFSDSYLAPFACEQLHTTLAQLLILQIKVEKFKQKYDEIKEHLSKIVLKIHT